MQKLGNYAKKNEIRNLFEVRLQKPVIGVKSQKQDFCSFLKVL